MKGRIHSIETFGAVDGPGIRTVFFMQGCPARCLYCHNPDTWKTEHGTEITVDEIVQKALRGKGYYGKDGGVTFSGGEPLMQGAFIAEAIDRLHEEGIKSAIDTSGTYLDEYSEMAISKADLVLLDIKHADEGKFAEITGRKQEILWQIIDCINKHEKPVWIRQVVLPGMMDSVEYMNSAAEVIGEIKNVEKIELLGYHVMGKAKYDKLGMEYRLKDMDPMNKAELEKLQLHINEKCGLK